MRFWISRSVRTQRSLSWRSGRAAAVRRAGVWLTVTLDRTEQRKLPTANIAVARRIVEALQEAGAGLLLGADGDGAHGSSPAVVHEELKEMVRAGLSPYQALVTGTCNVAQYLGTLESSGTVAVGKRVDSVLLSGNPLADIRHARELVGVMLDGRWLDRAVLDQGLLVGPKYWFENEIHKGIMPQLTVEQSKIKEHHGSIGALIDSQVQLSRRDGVAASPHLLQRLANELGAVRVLLTPEPHVAFDPQVRVWMREQARQSYSVTVPGLSSTH
jgi:hypothetical protein